MKYKVLPSLVHTFEFGGGSGAAQLLPLILSLAGDGMEEKEYQKVVIQPVVRMYATPDRAVRMALLENLERYIEKVSSKDVSERVWPNLVRQPSSSSPSPSPDVRRGMITDSSSRRTGHRLRRRCSHHPRSNRQVDSHHRSQGTLPLWLTLPLRSQLISFLLLKSLVLHSSPLSPPSVFPFAQLNDRLLNNDLLRHLSKTQTDVEPGIRTNTCILLSRLSKYLSTSTQRKVLIPAFARALRDPFVHARIAGLMALMATAEVFEKEDLAGKVIPAMSICLVDREKYVRLPFSPFLLPLFYLAKVAD